MQCMHFDADAGELKEMQSLEDRNRRMRHVSIFVGVFHVFLLFSFCFFLRFRVAALASGFTLPTSSSAIWLVFLAPGRRWELLTGKRKG